MGKQCAQGETKLLPSFRSNKRVTDHNEANLIQTFASHAKKVTQRWKTTAGVDECHWKSPTQSLHGASQQNRPFCWWWQTNNPSRSTKYLSSRLSGM